MENHMENLLSTQKSRLQLSITSDLSDKLNLWAEKLETTLSELTRKALSDYIEKLERNKREQEVAEACARYRQFNKKFSSEWAKFETRI